MIKTRAIKVKNIELAKYLSSVITLNKMLSLTKDEYSDYLHNSPFWKKIYSVTGKTLLSWNRRAKSENVLTSSDISIDAINEYITQYQGKYLNGNKFVHVATSKCDKYYINSNDDVMEPPIETEWLKETYDKYYINNDSSEMVYIAKVANSCEFIKCGKAKNGIRSRINQYNALGKNGSSTEQYMKDFIMSGNDVEWYAIIIPTNSKETIGDADIIYANPLTSENFEKWLRSALQNKFNKRFIENI